MILGWILLTVVVAMAVSLCSSFVRIVRAEYRARPRRPQARVQTSSSRMRRLGRIMVEPIIGR